jgi:hypothetical protein
MQLPREFFAVIVQIQRPVFRKACAVHIFPLNLKYMQKHFMNFWIYVYPFPALYFFFQHWTGVHGGDFAWFLILVPVLYGYIMPGIAVNVLKKWKFNTPFRIGNYYAHHGFKISGNMNTSFFLVSFATVLHPLNWAQIATLTIACGCVQGFLVWYHDTLLIKLGKLELSNVLVTAKMSPEEKAYSYAPECFFVLGASFALAALIALQYPQASLALKIGLGYLFVATTTSVAFGVLEWRAKRRRA